MFSRTIFKLASMGCLRDFLIPYRHAAGLRQVGKSPTGAPLSRVEFRTMTAHVSRQEKSYKATVQEVFNASKSIKLLRLHVAEPGFSFKAGQWVDFYVPGIPEIAGFSMTSAPYEANKGILNLAVKYGKFPPTHWIHTNCKGGEEILIQVGGDFYYDPQPRTSESTADLLLIGGGVGINPLVSILLHYCNLLKTGHGLGIFPGKLHLMHSVKSEEELIFRDTFRKMEAEHPSVSCKYFLTESSDHFSGDTSDSKIAHGRVLEQDIVNAVKQLQLENVLCYICGPSTMTDDVAHLLEKIGLKKEYIRYEKWW